MAGSEEKGGAHDIMSTKRSVALSFLVFLSGCVVAVFFAAFASADTHIVVGGNTDCQSTGIMAVKQAQNPGDNFVPVAYGTCDGDFAPFVGSTTPNDAYNQGVSATQAAWDDNCSQGQKCILEGFSYGDAPVSAVGTNVGADKPGSNTHVITNGNAWGETGSLGPTPGLLGAGTKIGAPVIGVPLNIPQVAGSENRNNVNDFWGDDAGQPVWAEGTMAGEINGDNNGTPPQHNIPDGDPTATWVSSDGVTQESYGQPLPGVVPPQDNPVVDTSNTLAPPPNA